MAFHPYLNFADRCREAFTTYQQIFGGELNILTMKDMPGDQQLPPEQADLVMHAALTLPDGSLLMASDDPTGGFDGIKGVWVHYQAADLDEADRVFKELSDGGEITMPIGETFWSPRFGMCVDRFGVQWMVDTPQPAGS